jgi:Fe-S-cluster containining protein
MTTTIPPLPELPTRVGAIPRAVALDMLAGLYETLPGMACKGLCDDSCTQVGASQLERDQLAAHEVELSDRDPGAVMAEYRRTGHIDRCPALTDDKRCSVYADRPFLCRAFGTVSARGLTGPMRFLQPMMCDHQCEPTHTIDMAEFADIVCRIEALSRVVTGVARGPLLGDSPTLNAHFGQYRTGGVAVAAGDIHRSVADAARTAAAARKPRRAKR